MTASYRREALSHFLVQAKQQTYAGQGDDATVTPLLPGTRQLEYRERDFCYRDIYAGLVQFVGQEMVYHRDQPIWSMSYAGGLVDPSSASPSWRDVFAFLRTALLQVSDTSPYRGPRRVESGDYRYDHDSYGSFDAFWGEETVTQCDCLVYRLHYSGRVLS